MTWNEWDWPEKCGYPNFRSLWWCIQICELEWLSIQFHLRTISFNTPEIVEMEATLICIAFACDFNHTLLTVSCWNIYWQTSLAEIFFTPAKKSCKTFNCIIFISTFHTHSQKRIPLNQIRFSLFDFHSFCVTSVSSLACHIIHCNHFKLGKLNIEPSKHIIAFIRMQMEISMVCTAHMQRMCFWKLHWQRCLSCVINFESEDLHFSSLFFFLLRCRRAILMRLLDFRWVCVSVHRGIYI